MKNWIVIVLSVLGATGAIAQESGEGKKLMVPIVVERKFLMEFPEARPQWKSDGLRYTAQFINPLNNFGYILVYDGEGNVVRREKELEAQEYPALIHDYLNQKYPGEGMVVWSSVDSSGNQSFYASKNSDLIFFDKNGQVMGAANSTKKLYGNITPSNYR